MRRYLLPAVFAISLIAPQAALAQEAPAGHRPEGMPAVVQQLSLSEASIHPKRRKRSGQEVHGKLPDGTWVEIDLDRNGNVEEVEADGKTGFAANTVEPLAPAAVRNNTSYPADAFFQKLEFNRGNRIEIEGYRRDGTKFEAEFTADGRLLELKNG